MIKSPRAILILLTGLNFLNYIDRAVIAAVAKPMGETLELTKFQIGILNSAFLIGYFLTAPFFGARADKGARKGLIAVGVLVWSVATIASGAVQGFWPLLLARIAVGVGEASYATLAPTIIDDLTPPDGKGKALSIFYLAIPLGYAMGYVAGGALSQHLGWRAAFYVAGGPGIVLALMCLWIVEPPRKLVEAKGNLIQGLKEMAQLPQFTRAVLGYCAYTAAVGAFSFWAPTFLLDRFPTELNDETANRWFGLVLVAAGAIGTIVGGRWADAALKKLPPVPDGARHDSLENKLAVNALLRVCAVGMLIAAPLTVGCVLIPSATGFFIFAFLVEIGLFLSTSPVAAAVLRSVPTERRASAMAAQLFAIHLLGDLWSSAALGLLVDAFSLVAAMMVLPIAFAISCFIWWPRKREAMA